MKTSLTDNEEVVPFSYEPRRVPKVSIIVFYCHLVLCLCVIEFILRNLSKAMYEHVSTLGSCVDPTNIPKVEGFRKFGQGFCLDASDAWYSGVASSALPLSTPAAYCLEWCSQNLRPDLVAVEISRDTGTASTTCYCSFSGGALPSDINLSAYSPAASRKTTYPGVGAVQSTDDAANAVCYQNIVRINVS